jgi:H+-translocating NAD(P) transhydrogenase subunit alpha
VPSSLPFHASQLYAKNVVNLLTLMINAQTNALELNFEDEIIAAAAVTHNGEIRVEAAKQAVGEAK